MKHKCPNCGCEFAEAILEDYTGMDKIISKHSSGFADTIHADKADRAIRTAVIEAYELGRGERE